MIPEGMHVIADCHACKTMELLVTPGKRKIFTFIPKDLLSIITIRN